jgi:hypothetical protein
MLALVIAVALAAPARAWPLNEMAVPLEAKDWQGVPVDFLKERGKVFVLLFVKPKQAESESALKEHTQVVKQRKQEGLETVLVVDQPKDAVDAWAKRLSKGEQFRIAVEESSRISTAYMAQQTPYAVVIDRDGRDIFEGQPERQRIQLALAIAGALDRPQTISPGQTSPRFRQAWSAYEHKDWKAAIAEAATIRDDPAVTPEDARDGKTFLAMIAAEGKKAEKAASAHIAEDDWYAAVTGLDEVAATFAGLPVADDAKKVAADLRGDAKAKKEIACGEVVHQALVLDKDGKRADATRKLEDAVKKWKGTRTADRAKKILGEWKGAKK